MKRSGGVLAGALRLGVTVALAACAGDGAGGGAGGGGADAAADAAQDVVTDAGPGTDAASDAATDVGDGATGDASVVDAGATDGGGGDAAADAGGDADAGPVTPAGQVFKVTSADQLIGGLAAYGRVDGAWIVQNDLARFLIQDSGVSAGLNLYGGNLIDADLVRGEGEPGNDRFRELFSLVGFRVPTAESVTVLADGSDGVEAALRVTGTDEKSRIIDILDSLVGGAYGFTIHSDTIVRPGIQGALLRTTVVNDTQKGWKDIVVGDLLSFGKLLQLFYAESGFSSPDAGLVTRLVAVGDGVSYGYARPSGSFLLPLVDASGTGALYETGLDLPVGGTDGFERWFVVGTGDVASVMEVLDQVRGEPAWVLEGALREKGTAAPVAGGLVTAMVDGHAYNQARTAEDGSWRMTLQPGVAYGLVASGAGRPDAAEVPAPLVVEVGETVVVDLEIAAPGFLGLEAGGPARIVLQAVDVPATDPRLGKRARTNGPRSLLSLDGSGTWPVEPGTWKVTVTRGPEYTLHTEQVVIEEAATTIVSATVDRVVDTTGWVAGDFHLHCTGSLDADMLVAEKLTQLAAEGVEVAASTDHDNVTDYAPVVTALGLGGRLHTMAGNEISVNGLGHFNAYPLPVLEDPYPLIGAKLWAGRTVQELRDHVEEVSPGAVFQVNHPRSQAMGYLAWLGFDPVAGVATVSGRTLAEGIDAVEVNNELGVVEDYLPAADAKMASNGAAGSEKVPGLRDWFGLLQAGHTIAGMGNSDSHDWTDRAGYPRTLLRVGTDDPAQVTDQMVIDAIRGQRAVVSGGIFVTVRADGVERMGHQEPVDGEEGAALEVTVQAPPWVDVARLEVYEDGRPLRLGTDEDGALVPDPEGELWVAVPPSEEPVRLKRVLNVPPGAPRWYVFVARGSGTSSGVFGGGSFGYTNPVYVTAP